VTANTDWFASEANKLSGELEAKWEAVEARQGDTKQGDA
jgi:hypothetical protein